MSETILVEEEEEEENSKCIEEEEKDSRTCKNRKEKRKEMKKKKRREKRKEIAEKEREEEEARLNDPEERKRMELMEEEERERVERERKEFEERERVWMEKMMEKKRKEEEEQEVEEEEQRRRVLEEEEKDKVENEDEEGSDWEYVEEGPVEIIWQGNEIIVKKKKVRVPKKNVDQLTIEENADRPTSNPLPPQSEAFADYHNASSAHGMYDNVAQQVPNFGTEQDKAHCPFHLKTGACRFGQRCSRVHFYPDKSCTLLIKNMYNGPGLSWEHDEGLEYTDEEVERCYEEFYEDVHTEFMKFGEIVNFKVCKNGSFHLRGNVYVHYKSLDSAVLAYHSINGRYFAGKQVSCEFVGVTKWKVAICGEFMKSRLKTCSRGTACNFIHCFRNPGGDYEWADWDKPPPRYWIKEMTALFGYSDEFRYEKEMENESLGWSRSSSKILRADEDRHHSRRSKSRETDCLSTGYGKSNYDKNDNHKSTQQQKHRSDAKKREEKKNEDYFLYRDNYHSKWSTHDTESGRDLPSRDKNRDEDRDWHHGHARKSSGHQKKAWETTDDWNRYEADSERDWSDGDKDKDTHRGRKMESSRQRKKLSEVPHDHGRRKRTNEIDSGGNWSDTDRVSTKHHRHQNKVSEFTDDYEDDKYRTCESDSERERSDWDRNTNTGHKRTRKSSRPRHNVSEVLDDHGGRRKRTHDTDSDGVPLDRDRNIIKHRTHKRKSSRRQNDVDDNRGGKNRTHDTNQMMICRTRIKGYDDIIT